MRLLLAVNKIEVIETGEQITLDEKQSQRAQRQWLNILNEKLKPQLYKIFGLLLYRMYNYIIYRNIRNINKHSYLQSHRLSVSKFYSEKMKGSFSSSNKSSDSLSMYANLLATYTINLLILIYNYLVYQRINYASIKRKIIYILYFHQIGYGYLL